MDQEYKSQDDSFFLWLNSDKTKVIMPTALSDGHITVSLDDITAPLLELLEWYFTGIYPYPISHIKQISRTATFTYIALQNSGTFSFRKIQENYSMHLFLAELL